MRKILAVLLLIVLMGALGGCKAKVEEGRLIVPVRLDEAALRQLVDLAVKAYTAQQGSNPLTVTVDTLTFLPPDGLAVTMRAQAENLPTVSGQAEMRFAVQDGLPQVTITRLEIPGVMVSEDQLQTLNRLLSTQLQEQMRRAGDRVSLREIAVESDALVLQVEVQLTR